MIAATPDDVRPDGVDELRFSSTRHRYLLDGWMAVPAHSNANGLVGLEAVVRQKVEYAVDTEGRIVRDRHLQAGQEIPAVAVEEVRFRRYAGSGAEEKRERPASLVRV